MTQTGLKRSLLLLLTLLLLAACNGQAEDDSADGAASTAQATEETISEEVATDEAAEAEVPLEVTDDSVVLEAGGVSETLGEFNRRFELVARSLAAQQGMELNDEMRVQLISFKPQFLDRRAVEVALLQEAEARGFSATDEDVQARLDEEILAGLPEGETLETFIEAAGFEDEAQLRATLLEDSLLQQVTADIEANIEVSDEDVAAAYEANPEQFSSPAQTCARHILLESVEDAEAVLSDLEGGADFAELAQERSTGPSAPQGGDLGCFGEGQMVAPFEEAALNAEVGEPVGPVETQFGQHVILVYERTEAEVPPLEDVAEALRQQLSQEAFSTQIDAIAETYEVQTYPEVIVAETEAALQAAQEAAEAAESEEASAAGGSDENVEDAEGADDSQ